MTRSAVEHTSATPIGEGLDVHVTAPRGNRQAFSRAEYDARIRQAQDDMAAADLDVLLVHTPENICYLTGFETSGYFEYQVLAIPASGEASLFIRNTERINVDESTHLPHAYLWSADTDYFEVTARLVDSLGVPKSARIGLEYHSWFVTAQVHTALTANMQNHKLVDAGRIVELRRLVKSPAEQAYVRAAAKIVDRSMAAAAATAGAGRSEFEVAAAAYHEHMVAGGEYPALPHFVKSGERLTLQHATASERILQAGDLLHMELLGVKRRYHAGLTRTVHIGQASTAVRQTAAVIFDIQDQMLADLKPGAAISEITKRSRARINAVRGDDLGDIRIALHDGDPNEFQLSIASYPGTNRRLGYSMGIGFPPTAGEAHMADFRESCPLTLESGMVFHMTSIVSPEMVFSETALITDDGWERLTQAPRELIEA
ncbi:M24 family metallopeptidase [Streptomyces sp. NPDC017964]|uniref:M24 family metallopeptidase n=1 Tax=Streptomyces sp. NPDC017964 TaxID=3365022 RepID=UPI0037986A88